MSNKMANPGISEAEYLRQVMQNSKEHECPNCGGKFFKQVFIMRSVSKIFTGMTADSMLPIPIWRCDDCGVPVEQLQPKEEEQKPKSNLIV